MCTKASRPFYSHCVQGILLKIRNSEKGLSKSLKEINYFFLRNRSLSTDRIMKKQKGQELVKSRSSGYKTSSEKFLY